MSWNRKMQGEFRPLEKAAWELHCSRSGLAASDRAERDSWYRRELKIATGKTSTKDCDSGRDFERCCAHFEALADAGIKWQLRLIQGDLRRIRYAAVRINPSWVAQFRSDADLERYVRGIAANAFGCEIDLHLLDDNQIRIVTQAVRIAANRA